jgi:acid phosphatase type 7
MKRNLNIVVFLLALILVACAAGASERQRPGKPVLPSLLPSSTTTTTEPPPPDPVIVAAGDIACAPGKPTTPARCQHAATAALIDQIKPDFVLTEGDEQYVNGELANFQQAYHQTWGRHLAKTLPVPGNHEYGTKGATGYFTYFDGQLPDDHPGYYSRDIGAWHVVFLDANRITTAQLEWLKADLAGSKARCIMANWHQPRFSSGKAHGNYAGVDPFWRALYAARADVVLNGHEHLYERFAPQSPDQLEDALGIRQFVVGTGGSELYGFSKTIQPNSERRYNDNFGVLKMTLHAESYDWQFIAIDGEVVDEGSATCN